MQFFLLFIGSGFSWGKPIWLFENWVCFVQWWNEVGEYKVCFYFGCNLHCTVASPCFEAVWFFVSGCLIHFEQHWGNTICALWKASILYFLKVCIRCKDWLIWGTNRAVHLRGLNWSRSKALYRLAQQRNCWHLDSNLRPREWKTSK